MRIIVFWILFWTTVFGPVLALVFTSPWLLFAGIGSFIGLLIFWYNVNPTQSNEDIAEKSKHQQAYDNEYGVISYFDKDKK